MGAVMIVTGLSARRAPARKGAVPPLRHSQNDFSRAADS